MDSIESRYHFIDPSKLYIYAKDPTDAPQSNPAYSPQRNLLSPNLTKEYHHDVMDYTDQVNQKTLLAILTQEEKIKQKKLFHLITQLERTQQQLAKLDEKFRQQESIETHPHISEDVANLQKVEQYKLSLVQKANQLNQHLEDNNAHILNLQSQVFQKRLQIRDLTQESWALQSQQRKVKRMHASMDVFPKTQKNGEQIFLTDVKTSQNVSSKQMFSSMLPPLLLKTAKLQRISSLIQNPELSQNQMEQLMSVLKEAKEVQQEILKVKDDIARRCTNFTATNNLLQDSIQTTIKYFESKQRIVGANGFADSLYFDISTVNATQNIENSIVSQNQKKVGINIKNILYEKLQTIMLNMIKEQQNASGNPDSMLNSQIYGPLLDPIEQSGKQSSRQQQSQLESLRVSMDQFLSLTPQQIIGLLTLNPSLLSELVSVFDLKQKSLGLLGRKVKILTQHIN